MARRMMILMGSPRKEGNTHTVVNWVAEGACEAGAEVEIVDACWLMHKNNGCIECMGCQGSDSYRCVVQDDAAPVLARMPQQDAIVFATPVFFMGFSAQLKRLIDRMYSLTKVDPDTGQFSVAPGLRVSSLALIVTAGGDESSGIGLISQHMRSIAVLLGQQPRELLVPFSPRQPGEMAANGEVKAKALAFGRELAD